MSNLVSKTEINVYFAIFEYQNIKAVFDKKLQNFSNLPIGKFNKYEMNIVNSMTNWNQENKIYILEHL